MVFVCRAEETSVRLVIFAILGLQAVCHSASARSLLQTSPIFVPGGLDACTFYVPSGCKLFTEASPRADSCSQNNSAQLTSVVTAADNDQVELYSLVTEANHGGRSLHDGLLRLKPDELQGVKIAFYGDSITKIWRDRNGHGMSAVYKKYFGEFSAAVLGVGGDTSIGLPALQHSLLLLCAHCHHDAGDQTGNLWWRLQHGQIFKKHAPGVSVMLIGTNDLATASCGVGEPGIKAAVPGVLAR